MRPPAANLHAAGGNLFIDAEFHYKKQSRFPGGMARYSIAQSADHSDNCALCSDPVLL